MSFLLILCGFDFCNGSRLRCGFDFNCTWLDADKSPFCKREIGVFSLGLISTIFMCILFRLTAEFDLVMGFRFF